MEQDIIQTTSPEAASVVVKKKSAMLSIWFLPLVALLTGLWLVYQSVQDEGVSVVIHFEKGQGIVANETQVKYEGHHVGLVKSLEISEGLSGVTATIELDKNAAAVLQDDTVFWMVEPEVSITSVTGLDTLLSGKYITFQIGEKTGSQGKSALLKLKPSVFEYNALKQPPLTPAYKGGLHITLRSKTAGSISKNAPVLFKKMTVGRVEKVELLDDGSFKFGAYIFEEHRNLVTRHTRFWNASGISLNGSLSSVSLEVDSLTSIILGGIAFENYKEGGSSLLGENTYNLYAGKKQAFSKRVNLSLLFKSGEGLSIGTALKHNGIKIGEVTSVSLSPNLSDVKVNVALQVSATNIAREDSLFWVVKPKLGLASTRDIETLVTGKYIAVQPGRGDAKFDFAALGKPPQISAEIDDGLEIVLQTPYLGSLKQGVKIYYRNVPVGKVNGYRLGNQADKVLIYITIEKEFSPLVREGTQFWNASGLGVDFGLFKGAKIRAESIESMLEGGVAFATPEVKNMGGMAEPGTVYKLNEEYKDAWLKWRPKISLLRDDASTTD